MLRPRSPRHCSLLAASVALAVVASPLQVHAAPPEGEAPPDGEAEPPPSKGDQLIEEGHEAFGNADYETAIDKYQAAVNEGMDARELLAQAHFRQGTVLYQKGEYQGALEHFQDAQALFPSAQFFYNIAQCYEALEDWNNAITNYKAYLRGSPNAKDKLNIENKIARLEKIVELEDTEGGDPTSETEPGTTVPGTDDKTPPPPGRAFIISGAVLTAVGAGIAIGGGVGFGATAADRSQQVDDVLNGGNPENLTLAQTRKLDDEGRQAETLQIVMASAGAAVGVVGIALLAVGLNKRKKGASMKLEAVGPTFGPQTAGISLAGRF